MGSSRLPFLPLFFLLSLSLSLSLFPNSVAGAGVTFASILAPYTTTQQLEQAFIIRTPGVGVTLNARGLNIGLVTHTDLARFSPLDPNIFDFSNNSLTNFPVLSPGPPGCTWCATSNLNAINLSSNTLGPNLLSPTAFIGSMNSKVRSLDLSDNPIKNLPNGFGTAPDWFVDAMGAQATVPIFRCSNCQLTGIGNNSFARSFSTLDLSQNDFSNVNTLYWPYTFSSNSFVVTTLLNLSHCGITKLPGINAQTQSTPPGNSASGTYTTIWDLSYNNFSSISDTLLNPMLDFSTVQFPGLVNLSHSNMRMLKSFHFDKSRLGNLDLSYNNFTRSLVAQNIILQQITGSPGVSGNLYLNDAGITYLDSQAFKSTVVYSLDLSGNYFPNATSWNTRAFDALDTNKLILNRCSMTSDTLSNNGGNPFENAANIVNLYMINDGTDPTKASWNFFNPLNASWLVNSYSPLVSTLKSVAIGEVTSVEKGFFAQADVGATWISAAAASFDVSLYLDENLSPFAANGVITNFMSGYADMVIAPRTTYTLQVYGHKFLTTAVPDITFPEADTLTPSKLTVPFDPAFLQRNVFNNFPSIPSVKYIAPSSYFLNISQTPWSSSLTSVPNDLLCDARDTSDFSIVLDLKQLPMNPVQQLPESFFDCLTPFNGFGSLTTIDFSTAQFRSAQGPYPQFLFKGLSRSGTVVNVDMQSLYAGVHSIPLGLWDDVGSSVGYGVGQAPTGTSKLNKARNCPYLVNQQCESCPAGSYTSSISGYYYCALCPLGSYCQNGANKPCPAGTYQPTKGQSVCIDCAVGRYNEVSGQSQSYSCLNCAAGTFNNVTGGYNETIFCQTCADGSIAALAGSSTCTACAAGTYMNPDRYSCSNCPAQTYRDLPGATNSSDCKSCGNGMTSVAGSTASTDCKAVSCPAGSKYDQASPQTNYCTVCSAGSYCVNNIDTACIPGSWSLAGLSVCTLCVAGKYNPDNFQTNETACLTCPAGSYQPNKGRASCISCPLNTFNPYPGSDSAANCLPCSASNVTNSICTSAAITGIKLSSLLTSSSLFLDPSTGTASMSRSSYAPIRGGDSLRLTAKPSDATLKLADAGDVPVGSSSNAHSDFDPTGDIVVSDTMFAIMLGLVLGAALPLILYRFMPNFVTKNADLMSQSHKLDEGGILVKRPTQYGAAWSIAFVFIAVYVAIRLGTASNATMVNTLQPSSSNSNTGTAQAAFQITVKAYGAPLAGSGAAFALDEWCGNSNYGSLLSVATGFTGNYTVTAVAQGQACVMMIDCLDCGIGAVGSFGVKVPYVNQLLEWEVFVSGAIPYSWSRYYGVIGQIQNQLLDAAATLKFSAIEAYFLDERTANSITYCTLDGSRASVSFANGVTCSLPTASSGTGFELAFSSYNTDSAQMSNLLLNGSTVALNFEFSKQDVVYQTNVSAKLSVFQILSSVLATVVSLLSVFMLVFQVSEYYVLRSLKISSGPMPVNIHVISQEEIAAEEAAAKKRADKLKNLAADLVHTIEDALPGHHSSAANNYTADETNAEEEEKHSSIKDPKRITVAGDSHEMATLSPAGSSNSATDAPAVTGTMDPAVTNLLKVANEGVTSPTGMKAASKGAAAFQSVAASRKFEHELADLRKQQEEERKKTQASLEALQLQVQQLMQQQQQQPLSNARPPSTNSRAGGSAMMTSGPSSATGTAARPSSSSTNRPNVHRVAAAAGSDLASPSARHDEPASPSTKPEGEEGNTGSLPGQVQL